MKELGRRLAARRKEAHLSARELAACANVAEPDFPAFEAGSGALGVAALTRLARALGVPENSFFHTDVQEAPALRTPTFMLSEVGRAGIFSLDDKKLLAGYLRQARHFAELGELMALPRLADQFRLIGESAQALFSTGTTSPGAYVRCSERSDRLSGSCGNCWKTSSTSWSSITRFRIDESRRCRADLASLVWLQSTRP